jgi:hypothetical protein
MCINTFFIYVVYFVFLKVVAANAPKIKANEHAVRKSTIRLKIWPNTPRVCTGVNVGYDLLSESIIEFVSKTLSKQCHCWKLILQSSVCCLEDRFVSLVPKGAVRWPLDASTVSATIRISNRCANWSINQRLTWYETKKNHNITRNMNNATLAVNPSDLRGPFTT